MPCLTWWMLVSSILKTDSTQECSLNPFGVNLACDVTEIPWTSPRGIPLEHRTLNLSTYVLWKYIYINLCVFPHFNWHGLFSFSSLPVLSIGPFMLICCVILWLSDDWIQQVKNNACPGQAFSTHRCPEWAQVIIDKLECVVGRAKLHTQGRYDHYTGAPKCLRNIVISIKVQDRTLIHHGVAWNHDQISKPERSWKCLWIITCDV